MNAVASRPENPAVSYTPIAHQPEYAHNYKDSGFGAPVQPVSSRSSSVSSFKTNYSASTAPTAYSPTPSSLSYRQCDSAASLDKILESIFKRVPQEVYENIIDQLEILHTGSCQSGCVTCFQRDLHALSLTCRPWEKAVRARL